jgi:hypothetical protein
MKKPVADVLVAEYTRLLRAGGPVGAVFPQPLSACDFNEAQKFLISEARKVRRQKLKLSNHQPATPPQPQPKPVAVKPAAPSPSKPKVVPPKPAPTVRPPAFKAQSLKVLEELLYPAPPKSAIPKRPALPPSQRPASPKPLAASPSKPKITLPEPVAPTPAPAPKPQPSNKLKRMFYLQHEKCFFCGEKLALAEANIEHLNPISLGGKNTSDNVVVCHKTLNDTFADLPLKQKFEFVLKAAGSFRCPKK